MVFICLLAKRYLLVTIRLTTILREFSVSSSLFPIDLRGKYIHIWYRCGADFRDLPNVNTCSVFADIADTLQAQYSQQPIRGIATFQTLSVHGIAIVVLSFTLIIFSWTLSTCVRKSRGGYKIHADVANGKLNLLRMALEGRGYAGWAEKGGNIPTRLGDGADIRASILVDGGVEIRYANSHSSPENQMQEKRSGLGCLEGDKPPAVMYASLCSDAERAL